ncbi:hypothetical protein QF042_001877 [Pedobacter sp. W3I1]|uniref:hypothetical protein n=1 Tax=Pedobacter sp. W3I1 TaxID=3042291 RepID=UPI0027888F03|nr:hypothetical protein [Pedobacter sp. W3I1]MDQ0638312.1 hypothetical protein [Pedobacter sp. W3I1]
MKLKLTLFFNLVYSSFLFAQQEQLTFTHQNIDFSAAPRTSINPMSIKLWDNYNNGGPTSFGTVMEIYGLSSHQTGQLYFGGWDNSKIRYREAFYAQGSWSDWMTLLDSKNNVESSGKLMITGQGNHYITGGNFGIGTINPQDKLTVAGKIGAQEIKVSTNAGADFVFEPGYKLPDLNELEKFVKTNKHLPEIPTAKEMIENGINLGELNVKLLQKVEELTLHLIEKDKQMSALQAVVEGQAKILKDIQMKLK